MALRYVAYNQLGRRVQGVLETDSEQAAYAALQEDGLIPYRIERVRPPRALAEYAPSLFKPKPQDLIDFTRGLATLLKSGIPLRESLVTLRDQSRSPGLKAALRRVVTAIEGGDRFSDACAANPGIFPDFFVRLVRVGEATGEMAMTIEQVALTLTRRKNTRDKVRGALVYPALSMVAAGVAAFILLSYSLPSLIGLLDEFGSDLPPTTRVLIAISDFLEVYKGRMSLGMAAAIVALIVGVRTPRGARLRDRVLLRTPVVGPILVKSNMFSLTSTFSTLLDAGIPPIEALQLSKESLGNSVLRDELGNVIDVASSGTRLGQAFADRAAFPAILAQGISTGESSGSMPATLRALAEYFEQETNRSVAGATELIQPAVIMVVAGIVGFVAVAVISGIYTSLGTIR
jgi:type II secretory pathway component PulF